MRKLILKLSILSITFSSCFSLSDSGNSTLIKESSNKQQDKKAILFLRESGATVADSYQVTVADNEYKLAKDEVGNTFTVDTDHGKTWLDTSSINFKWLSNDTLQIEYEKKLRTFIQENSIHGVTIIYKSK